MKRSGYISIAFVLSVFLCAAVVLDRWQSSDHGRISGFSALLLHLKHWQESRSDRPLSLGEERERYDRLNRILTAFARFNLPLDRVDDTSINVQGLKLKLRLYRDGEGRLPIIVRFHAGGWMYGNLDAGDAIARLLARNSQALVVSVDYPLAPEWTYPQSLQILREAVHQIKDRADAWGGDPSRIALAGDSAGAHLAIALALSNREDMRLPILAQLLIYPPTELASMDNPSYRAFSRDFMLSKQQMDRYADALTGLNTALRSDPLVSPLLAADLQSFPPSYILTAEYDVLRDEGEMFAKRLLEVGHGHHLHRAIGLMHGFASAGCGLNRAVTYELLEGARFLRGALVNDARQKAQFEAMVFIENIFLHFFLGVFLLAAAYHMFLYVSVRNPLYALFGVWSVLMLLSFGLVALGERLIVTPFFDTLVWASIFQVGAAQAFVSYYALLNGRDGKRSGAFMQRLVFLPLLALCLPSLFAYKLVVLICSIGVIWHLWTEYREVKFGLLLLPLIAWMSLLGCLALTADSVRAALIAMVPQAFVVIVLSLQLANRMRALEASQVELEKARELEQQRHLEDVRQLHSDLQARVYEKTRDIQAMLQSTHIGIFSIDRSLNVHPNYTVYLEKILEDQQLGQRTFEEVFLSRVCLSSEALDQIRVGIDFILNGDSISFEANHHVLPLQLEYACPTGVRKTLEIDWVPVLDDDDVIERLMLTVTDCTESNALRKESSRVQGELEIMAEILALPAHKAADMQIQIQDYLARLEPLLQNENPQDVMNPDRLRAIYIILHTLKGVVRTHRFIQLAQLIHETEEIVKEKSDNAVETGKRLLSSYDQLRILASRYAQCYQKLCSAI